MSASLSLLRAKLASRDKHHAEALRHYAEAEVLPADERLRIDLYFDRGKVNDSLGNYDAAMRDFQAGHKASVALLRLQFPDIDDSAEVDDWGPQDEAGVPLARQPFDDGLPPDPIFVVGFPRSGTTLLEQLLDAHPQLQSMDEQLAIEAAIDELRALGYAYPQGLENAKHAGSDAHPAALLARGRESDLSSSRRHPGRQVSIQCRSSAVDCACVSARPDHHAAPASSGRVSELLHAEVSAQHWHALLGEP